METIKAILERYRNGNHQIFIDTIEMLCSKGVRAGVYQNYEVLGDVLIILTKLESFAKKGE